MTTATDECVRSFTIYIPALHYSSQEMQQQLRQISAAMSLLRQVFYFYH